METGLIKHKEHVQFNLYTFRLVLQRGTIWVNLLENDQYGLATVTNKYLLRIC